jgi:hypothetical protein
MSDKTRRLDQADDKDKRIAELEARSKRWDSINRSIAEQRDELAAWVKEITDFAPGFVDREMVDRGKALLTNVEKA